MYKFTADNIGDITRGLSMPQLIHFLGTYDNYVQEFFESHDSGSQPVCMLEYYTNDYTIPNI